MWRILDALVHVLYVPLRWVCDRYEARMLRSAPDWVDDPNMSLADVETRFDAAWELGMAAPIINPVGYRCQHMSITAGGSITKVGPVTSWCGCKMEPVFPALTA